MENFIIFLYHAVESPVFLLFVLCVSVAIKIMYVTRFAPSIWAQEKKVAPLFFLLVSIVSALICDVTWFVKLAQKLFIPMPYSVVVFFIRIAWAFLIVQYQALSLFLQSLTHAEFRVRPIHRLTSALTGLFFLYFAGIAFLQINTLATAAERDIARENMDAFEFLIMRYIVPYVIGTFAILGLYAAFRSLTDTRLPKILRKQIKLFTCFLILPYFGIEFILATCFKAINDMHFVVSISTLMLAGAIYYCLRNVIKLRFFNSFSQVQGSQNPYVINQFKAVLEQLNDATNSQELIHITQAFFKEAFAIPPRAVQLIIRQPHAHSEHVLNPYEQHIEQFLTEQKEIINPLGDTATDLLVLDEIAFNNFYLHTPKNNEFIRFLNKISADLFLPIYSNKRIIGSIVVATHDRRECFSHSEQDAMIAFASYVGNIINLLHQKDREALIYREKKLKDVLYTTHQEINQYKESIHTFLRRSQKKVLGIIFYKNGHFSLANDDAQYFITMDPNTHTSDPLSVALQHVAQHVETFKTSYTYSAQNEKGQTILLSGVPHINQSHTTITASYPDVADVIMNQMHLLHDPHDWDYLLYLSSTKAGAAVSAFIPGSGETLLNGKIQLLKSALNKKAVLLNCVEEDTLPTVQLIHNLSLKEHLHTLSLNAPTRAEETAVKLFGSSKNEYELPLLQRLTQGTLFIKNIHYLDMTSQSYLAEFITRGRYQLFESEHTMSSSARILCSSNQILSDLVQNGRFCPELYALLKKQTVVIPSLFSLSSKELDAVINGFSQALITSYAVKNLFALTEKEKHKIVEQLPSSFHELKMRVEQLTLKKSEHTLIGTMPVDQGFQDPVLIHAARLGKQALKNPEIMSRLWSTFKNQNKIALFLGVNRSSVNRRCKAFQIADNSQGVA